ncbi:MAG: LysR family transcriptional regulator [Phascolarctobacterium sp.]|nr:LysR family transcriptional regulator [Phascolarctobacterium sp.]
MHIEMLKSFLTVAECRSFTMTAQHLNFTQPSISNHIATLEKTYGVSLLVRDGKNIYLTEAGKAFIPFAQKILSNYEESISEMKKLVQRKTVLRIATSSQILNLYILGALKQLRSEYPELDIEVRRYYDLGILSTDAFTKKLYNLVLLHTDFQPLNTNKQVIGETRCVWVVSKNLYKEVGSDSIYDYPYLGYMDNTFTKMVWYDLISKKTDVKKLNRSMSFSDGESLIWAAWRSMGCAFVSYIKVKDLIERGELVELEPDKSNNFPIFAITNSDTVPTPELKRLIELLIETPDM